MTQDRKVCFVSSMTQILLILALLVGAGAPLCAQDLNDSNTPQVRETGRKAVEKYLVFNRLYKERYLQQKKAKAQRRLAKKKASKKSAQRSVAQNSKKKPQKNSQKNSARPQAKKLKKAPSKGLAHNQGS